MSNEKGEQDKLTELKITKLRLEVWHKAVQLALLILGGASAWKLAVSL